jgi:uncharacterized protein (TIGR00369 family)
VNMLSELDSTLSGIEQLLALISAGLQPAIHETLDIALVAAEEGLVAVEARPGKRHLNPAGIIQDGYLAVVLDTACGCAVHSMLPPKTVYTTLELKVSYHRPVTLTTGHLRAEGRILSVGRRAAFSEGKVFDGRFQTEAQQEALVFRALSLAG